MISRIGVRHLNLIAATAMACFGQQVAPAATLLSHYTFDSDYTNEVSATLDSPLQNGTFIDNAMFAVGGGAAYFDGFDDFASAGVNSVPGAGGAYYQGTVAMWVKGDGGTSSSRVFMGQQNGDPNTFGSDNRMSWQIDTNSQGSIQTFIRAHDGTESNNRLKFRHQEAGSVFPTDWNNGDWHHLAFTWRVDEIGTVAEDVQIYIDGQPVGTVITEAGLEADPAKSPLLDWESPGVFIGARNNRIAQGGSADAHFKGWLDDIRVYDGVLSASEVQSLYALRVPEPAGMLLVGLAALPIVMCRLRRR